MKKRSFFERLSGSATGSDDFDAFDDDLPRQPMRTVMPMSVMGPASASTPVATSAAAPATSSYAAHDDDQAEGQLPVDVYQTPNEIVIRAFVAGVLPADLGVSISRDIVVIDGSREERSQVTDDNYFHQELFWGSFSRTIALPQEIDVENSSAGAKDGLITIILPKLDKAKQTKLKVKAG
jgi:HSP20 family molecular chaperone IbpA